MDRQAKRFHEFGPFRFYADDRVLLAEGRQVKLPGRAMDVFVVLFERRGEPVSKDELLRRVWGRNGADERNLFQAVKTLRKALRHGGEDEYIETLREYGYRFAAPVRSGGGESGAAAEDGLPITRAGRSSPDSEPAAAVGVDGLRLPGSVPASAAQAVPEVRPAPARESRLARVARGAARKWREAILILALCGAAGLVISRREREPSPPLTTYDFDVVTLDARGNEKERRRGTARYFVEDLGAGVKLEMVFIPGGKFLMGTGEAEAPQVEREYLRHMPQDRVAEIRQWVPHEMPQREVSVRSFFLGKFEVTQAQWRAVVELLPQINRELHADPAKFKGDDLPVTHVSWDEAQEFCERLSRKTGRPYRLPSEAEWEYACRAGTTTPFHFGETITTQYANFNGKYPYAEAPEGEYRGRTTPVGSFRVANAFGLYDMHGNVWEWCLDPMRWTYVEAPTDGSAWTTGDVKWSRRVTRGGAYGNDNSPGFESYYCCGGAFFYNFCAFDCRSARRNAMSKMARSHDLGFRLALSLVPQ